MERAELLNKATHGWAPTTVYGAVLESRGGPRPVLGPPPPHPALPRDQRARAGPPFSPPAQQDFSSQLQPAWKGGGLVTLMAVHVRRAPGLPGHRSKGTIRSLKEGCTGGLVLLDRHSGEGCTDTNARPFPCLPGAHFPSSPSPARPLTPRPLHPRALSS